MKQNILLTMAACATLGLASARAQETITSWTFDNLPVALNTTPSPSTGLGSASALGMSNTYDGTNSVSNPAIVSLSGSSTGAAGPNAWQIVAGSSINGDHGSGWSTNAPIGSQGAAFSASTLGYYKITASFDVYATANAEANLQVEYTTDGKNFQNANIVSAGSGTIVTNSNPADAATVQGTYIHLVQGWNNGIKINLTGLSAVDNDPQFALRLVNASTGTDDVDTTGAVYSNISGSWTFDNVSIQGGSMDTIADWTFNSELNDGTVYTNTFPDIGGAQAGEGYSMGFNNNYVYSSGTGSVDQSDITATGGSSTGPASPNAWRVRGGPPGNPSYGYNTAAPIGTQGTEYDVNTSGYTNIIANFDVYFTSAAEANICVLYTTDGWATTNVAQNLAFGSNASLIQTNTSSPNTVAGTYFHNSKGQGFYNNMVVDFTGNHAVENNPLFGFRVVNASTGPDCVNYTGAIYNNNSGNWRFDNVTVSGTAGNTPPALALDPTATVDGPFTNTFTDSLQWRTNINAVYVNGLLLTNIAYTTNIAGQLVFTPALSALLQSSGLKSLVITARGYGSAKVSQPLGAGVAAKLALINPVSGPSASGGTLVSNPFFLVSDQYGNGTTNPYNSVSITASVGGGGAWTLGGDLTQPSANGLIQFTNLTATLQGSSAISNAYISFAITGYPPLAATNSAPFIIGSAPVPFTPGNLAVLRVDSTSANTTFSIVELDPSTVAQPAPVNIVPVPATGTNALRMANSGSTGRLALSDDGTLLCFGAFVDDSAATPDETLNLTRAAAGMSYTNGVAFGITYTSISYGGSQARAACILGDGSGNWIADDKGGLYEGNIVQGNIATPNLNAYNNVAVKSFGGTPYIETQKAVAGQNIPVVYALGLDPSTGLYDVTFANNLGTDGNASDFYLVSTNNGSTYDILYVCDQNSNTQGVIRKYSWLNGAWADSGTYTNTTSVDGMFAATNGLGGAYIFYTTGSGGVAGNSVIRLNDAAGWNQNISITSSNLIYTTPAGTSLKGLTFVPQKPGTAKPVLAPVLIPQAKATVGSSFAVTTSPVDPAWQSAITSITVNGTVLPSNAYDVSQAGQIAFTPANAAVLQGTGMKNIVVNSAGYSQSAVFQLISQIPNPVLGSATLTSGGLTFGFISTSGLTFSVHATNNLEAPLNTWPVVGSAVENPPGSGHFQFTDSKPATNTTEFYRISQP